MPYAAQIAPGFAVNVGDFDGDGNEDVFLSQNFITLATGMLRPDDAGRGLWLRGTGGGKLEAVPGRGPASWFMANSAVRRWAILTGMGGWIWR